MHGHSACCENAFPLVFGVKVILVLDIKRSNHIVEDLVCLLKHGIGLRIPCGDKLLLNTIFILTSKKNTDGY